MSDNTRGERSFRMVRQKEHDLLGVAVCRLWYWCVRSAHGDDSALYSAIKVDHNFAHSPFGLPTQGFWFGTPWFIMVPLQLC